MRTSTIRNLAVATAEAYLENIDNPNQERIQVRLKDGNGISVVVRVYVEKEEEELIEEDAGIKPNVQLRMEENNNDSNQESSPISSISETVKAGTEGANKSPKGKTNPK